jgi:hypothetical protein
MAQNERDLRAWWLLNLSRIGVVSLPFLLVLALTLGFGAMPTTAMKGLQALYAVARPLPQPAVSLTVALVAFWIFNSVKEKSEAWRLRWRDNAGLRLALDQSGIARGEVRRIALRARKAFDREVRAHGAAGRHVSGLSRVAQVVAPDPWIDGMPHGFDLLSMQLQNSSPPLSVFLLARSGTPYRHPLPFALVRHWNEGRCGVADLPRVLTRLEPFLQYGDFAGSRDASVRYARLFGTIGAVLFTAGAAAVVLLEPTALNEHAFWIGAGILGCVLGLLPLSWWAKWALHQRSIKRRIDQSGPAGAGRVGT